MYNIPVRRELIYELKEKIYHNQYKAFHSASLPSYYQADYGPEFPIFTTLERQITVEERYGKEYLDSLYRPSKSWIHISRTSEIHSNAVLHSPVVADDSHVCPAKSERNIGRQGSFIDSVIEFGSFYHRLIPESSKIWFKEKLDPQIFAKAEVSLQNG